MSDLISRQAAKNVLANLGIDIEDYWEDAIDELPSVEPEKCEDCISRQAAINAFERFIHELGINDEPYNYGEMALSAQNVPSVESERKPGHWEWDQRAGEYVCSECGCNPIYERTTPDVSEIDKYRFCRWCGAKMEEVNADGDSC